MSSDTPRRLDTEEINRFTVFTRAVDGADSPYDEAFWKLVFRLKPHLLHRLCQKGLQLQEAEEVFGRLYGGRARKTLENAKKAIAPEAQGGSRHRILRHLVSSLNDELSSYMRAKNRDRMGKALAEPELLSTVDQRTDAEVLRQDQEQQRAAVEEILNRLVDQGTIDDVEYTIWVLKTRDYSDREVAKHLSETLEANYEAHTIRWRWKNVLTALKIELSRPKTFEARSSH